MIAVIAELGGRAFVGPSHREGSPIDRVETVRLLLKAGAPVNDADDAKRTALIWAASAYPGGRADPVLLRLLLDAGAKVDARDATGQTALVYAATSLDAGRQPGSALSINPEAVCVLLAAGADPVAPDAQGETALELARRDRGDRAKQVVQLLERPETCGRR